MIPWLTECIRPNGLPMATTQLPTTAVAVAQSGRRQVVTVELEHGDIGLGVAPDACGNSVRPSCRKIRILPILPPSMT